MDNKIEKPESPSPDDILAAIQSFNDPGIITNIFRELGWSYSLEIKETLIMAKQNANLSIKFKAIKHLRELLREAAETSGYTANVSQTFPNAQGGQTTFHAKRISNILNPTKQIESTIKEPKDDKIEETEPNRGGDRGESQDKERFEGDSKVNRQSLGNNSLDSAQDTGDTFPSLEGCPGATPDHKRSSESDGVEPSNGGETPRPVPGGARNERTLGTEDISGRDGNPSGTGGKNSDSQERNPCIKTRPPTCDQDLFPGISSEGD